ncbi:hypothetical protein AHAS_Ahas07G0121700 [Arachis hypogaea]
MRTETRVQGGRRRRGQRRRRQQQLRADQETRGEGIQEKRIGDGGAGRWLRRRVRRRPALREKLIHLAPNSTSTSTRLLTATAAFRASKYIFNLLRES